MQNKAHQLTIKQKWEKSTIRLSKETRDIIHGYIMSDGYIPKNRNNLFIAHGANQKKFVLWLYTKFRILRTETPIRQYTRKHPKTGAIHTSYGFSTRSFVGGFRSMWYTKQAGIDGKYQKKLPTSIACFFNETFISVWFAGDGTKTIGHRGAKFEVTCFTVKDRLKLKALFFQKFNIQTKIISSGVSTSGRPQWALVIPASEYTKFRKLITKNALIPTLFPHKLHKQ